MNRTPTSHAAQAGIDLDKHNVVQRLRDLLEGAAAWSAGETARRKIYAALDLLNGAASSAPETAQADDAHEVCRWCDGEGIDGEQGDEPGTGSTWKCTSCNGTGRAPSTATGKADAANAGNRVLMDQWNAGAALLLFQEWKGYPLPKLNADGNFDKDWLHREWVAFQAGLKRRAPATSAADAKDAVLADVLNTTLWLYRRLPQAYGSPPFVDKAILTMAERLGLDDVPEAIKERAAIAASQKGKTK